jgi:hypothetical protein
LPNPTSDIDATASVHGGRNVATLVDPPKGQRVGLAAIWCMTAGGVGAGTAPLQVTACACWNGTIWRFIAVA